MVNWGLYNEILRGNSEGDEVRSIDATDALEDFAYGFEENPGYDSDSTVNGESQPLIFRVKSDIECDVVARPGETFYAGDYLEHKGETWIVIESYTDRIGLTNGTAWLCNTVIHFQNHSDKIYDYPCVINRGTYNKVTTDPDYLVISNTYKMFITYDENTKYLFVDKRIATDLIYNADGDEVLEVYQIMGLDKKTKNFVKGSHLYTATIQRDVFDPESDDIEKMVCNYWVDESSQVPSTGGSCYIEGSDAIMTGFKKTYRPVFVNTDGTHASEIVPIWEIEKPSSVIVETNGDCVVTVPFDEDLIGEEITIKVTDENGTYGNFTKKVEVISIG